MAPTQRGGTTGDEAPPTSSAPLTKAQGDKATPLSVSTSVDLGLPDQLSSHNLQRLRDKAMRRQRGGGPSSSPVGDGEQPRSASGLQGPSGHSSDTHGARATYSGLDLPQVPASGQDGAADTDEPCEARVVKEAPQRDAMPSLSERSRAAAKPAPLLSGDKLESILHYLDTVEQSHTEVESELDVVTRMKHAGRKEGQVNTAPMVPLWGLRLLLCSGTRLTLLFCA